MNVNKNSYLLFISKIITTKYDISNVKNKCDYIFFCNFFTRKKKCNYAHKFFNDLFLFFFSHETVCCKIFINLVCKICNFINDIKYVTKHIIIIFFLAATTHIVYNKVLHFINNLQFYHRICVGIFKYCLNCISRCLFNEC